MTAAAETFVIVGGGVTGGRAAETLRQEGFDGRIVLIGAEPTRPYERPPLSKGLIRGEIAEEEVYLRPVEYYAEQQITLRLGTLASAISPAEHVVQLSDGERIAYDKLLIATGVTVRRLNLPGAQLSGIHYLRTIHDAQAIRAASIRAQHAVVIGAGFIGAEITASLRTQGLAVTLVEMLPIPLQRVLGDQIGPIYAQIHRDHGVDLRLGEGIAAFRGSNRVEEVVTTSGAILPADLVIVGVGVQPNLGWLEGSGLEVSNGVIVDEYQQSNLPGIYAAGDLANWWHPGLGERLRIEHNDNAQNQGVAAAKNMLGRREAYAPVPFFWSDQYDLTLQYVGHASRWDEIVFRGDIADRKFVAFYLRADRIHATLGVNRTRDVNATKRLIRDRVPVTRAQLADDQVDLRRLGR